MVHALLESWRILEREGTLLDLRPLHDNRAVELLTTGSRFVPGYVADLTGAADDAACAKAIDEVTGSGHFSLQMQDTFEFAIYWNDLTEFSTFAEEKWFAKRRLSPEVLEHAQRHVAESGSPYRIRIRYNMHLAVYRKENLSAENDHPYPSRAVSSVL
jgi:hypothetical protein